MLRTLLANLLRTLQLRPRLRLAIIILATVSLAAASYADLLPYPSIATGYVSTGPAPIGAQGIEGHITYGPITPVCYVNGTVAPGWVLELPEGIVYGHGLTLTVPIHWTGNCYADGSFTVVLSSPGVYHFTLSDCTSVSFGCTNLPTTVTVLPFQMAQLNVYADTGIR